MNQFLDLFLRRAPGRAKRWRVIRGSRASRGVEPWWAGGVGRTAGRPGPAKQNNAPCPSAREGLGSPVAFSEGRRTAKGGFVSLLFALLANTAQAGVLAIDDAGREIKLEIPATRIISLAPHITELLYAIGAGSAVVGTVAFSDYPSEAQQIPQIGSGAGIDSERIVALQPDLVVAWKSGNSSIQVSRLQKLGLVVFITEPRRIVDVASLMERLGRLTGKEKMARQLAAGFREKHKQLRQKFSERITIPVFFQILDTSLMTVNGRHLISDVITLCGGRNIFADLPILAPRVDLESVVAKNPSVILISGYPAMWPEWRDRWNTWPKLSAIAGENLFFIPPELIFRHSPRILLGAEKICADLELSRVRAVTSTNR